MAVTTIRVPLTDINGNDFMTGKKVAPRKMTERTIEYNKNVKKKFQEKVNESKDGMIHVEGFGMVKVK